MIRDQHRQRIYDGDGDRLMESYDHSDRIVLIPDARPSKTPDPTPRIRVMWGQHLLEDLLAGRYRSFVCALNDTDNSHGIIAQLAALLPTSQWTERSITQYAQRFGDDGGVKVIKIDMDMIEVLGFLRPRGQEHLTLHDLATGFRIVHEMLTRKTQRLPSASVSFLGARSNALRDESNDEPTFETVLRVMNDAGYHGDVYPAPSMWESAPTAVFARYPFPESLTRMRDGGY